MLNACVLLKVVPTKADVILDAIKVMKAVRKSFFAYGRFDIILFVEVNDYKHLRELTGQINDMSGVRSTETLAEA